MIGAVCCRIGAAMLAALLLAAPAWADRPFLATDSAAAEEDDDEVWSVEAYAQRLGDLRGLAVQAEYAIRPTDSVQFGVGREKVRGGSRTSSAEAEYKHLFNRIGRDGWGIGVVAAVGASSEEGGAWRVDAVALRVPFTLAVGEDGAQLHLNVGVEKVREERRAFGASVAFEHPLPWRSTGFVELARVDRATLVHAGVRHWVRRERIAIDIGLQQERADGERRSGLVIGVGFYDL